MTLPEIERVDDPSCHQTSDQIVAYYKPATVGARACIRNTQGGFLHFTMTEIVERGDRTVKTKHSPQSGGSVAFYYDGRNWKYPGGQSSLVVPTPEIDEWIKKHGTVGKRFWRSDAEKEDATSDRAAKEKAAFRKAADLGVKRDRHPKGSEEYKAADREYRNAKAEYEKLRDASSFSITSILRRGDD